MSLRITGGSMRGRVLHVPAVKGLRPTPAIVREALFSMLGPLKGARFLDLFAGTGIMSLEALSRGAAAAVAVERHRRLAAELRRRASRLGVEGRLRIVAHALPGALTEHLAGEAFDVVFADPPYACGWPVRVLDALDAADIRAGVVFIEESARAALPGWPAGWRCDHERRYGDTMLYRLHRQGA